MSLSELVSFSVSGSTAAALSALITNRVSPEAERRGRSRQNAGASRSARPSAAQSAASGVIFFFTYYVAATSQFRAGPAERSTRRAASNAFLVGATASVFARLFGPHPDSGAEPAGYRWSLQALEDDLLLAIDPGLTFGVHEILARGVAGLLAQRSQTQTHTQPQRQGRLAGSGLVAAVTAFLLAATSKAVAAGLTHPLHAAAAEATKRRYAAAAAREYQADAADEPLIMLADEEETGGWTARSRAAAAGREAAAIAAAAAARRDPEAAAAARREAAAAAAARHEAAAAAAAAAAPGRRRFSILAVLLQMLRAGGVRALYAGWLRTVATAALGHGLTMALQRSIFAFLVRLVASQARPRSGRPSSSATAAEAARSRQPDAILPEASPAAPPALPAAPFPEEDRLKVKEAVESWLDSSSVASDRTVEVDDSISNVSSRRPRTARRPALAAPQRPQAAPRQARQARQAAAAAAGFAPPSRAPAPAPMAFYPDPAPAAGAGEGRDFDDDSGSIVFNMVSKSPRVIRGREDDL